MTTDDKPLRAREAIRAILITPEAEVLLMRIRLPGVSDSFWIAPGGGREPGESVEVCLRRELQEELGLLSFEVGPLVWLRQHTFDWGAERLCQSERYHVVHVERFEPHMTDATELQVLEHFRWWPAADLTHATERLTPLSLAVIVGDYLANGPPQGPLALEVLND